MRHRLEGRPPERACAALGRRATRMGVWYFGARRYVRGQSVPVSAERLFASSHAGDRWDGSEVAVGRHGTGQAARARRA